MYSRKMGQMCRAFLGVIIFCILNQAAVPVSISLNPSRVFLKRYGEVTVEAKALDEKGQVVTASTFEWSVLDGGYAEAKENNLGLFRSDGSQGVFYMTVTITGYPQVKGQAEIHVVDLTDELDFGKIKRLLVLYDKNRSIYLPANTKVTDMSHPVLAEDSAFTNNGAFEWYVAWDTTDNWFHHDVETPSMVFFALNMVDFISRSVSFKVKHGSELRVFKNGVPIFNSKTHTHGAHSIVGPFNTNANGDTSVLIFAVSVTPTAKQFSIESIYDSLPESKKIFLAINRPGCNRDARIYEPKNGACYEVGDTLYVKWEYIDFTIANATIDFSNDGGKTWISLNTTSGITPGSPQWLNFAWVIPPIKPGSDESEPSDSIYSEKCIMSVHAYGKQVPGDKSDGYFSIRQPGKCPKIDTTSNNNDGSTRKKGMCGSGWLIAFIPASIVCISLKAKRRRTYFKTETTH